jgi:predicted alpha/beta-hydrolase family hydrolase
VNVHGAHSSLSEGGGHRSCGGRMSSLVVAEGGDRDVSEM